MSYTNLFAGDLAGIGGTNTNTVVAVGATGARGVNIASGTLDTALNFGAEVDTVTLTGQASTAFTVRQDGTNVVISDGLGNDYMMSLTSVADTLTFSDGSLTVGLVGNNVVLNNGLPGGTQTLTNGGAPVSVLTPTGGGGGTTKVLTTNVDVATSNQFSAPLVTNPLTLAPAMTLTLGDTLTGDGANSTLTATLDGTATSGVTTTGVENFVLTTLAATAVSGSLTGVKSITSTGSFGDTTVTGLQSKLETVNLTNATNSGVVATVANAALTGSADTATINLSNVNNTTAAAGAVSIAPTSGANGYETFVVNSTGSSANAITGLTGGSGLDKTLTIGGTQALTINSRANGTPIDASLTTIDAAGMAAGVTIGGLTSTYASLFAPSSTGVGAVSITGGAGNDSLFINAANSGNNLKIVGGDGTDRVTFAGANSIVTSPTMTGVEELRLTGATGNGYGATAGLNYNFVNVSGVTKLVMDGAAGAGNTSSITVTSLAQPTAGLNLDLVGDKTAASQSFNGLNYNPTGAGGSADTVAVTVGNQGQAIGAGNSLTIANLNLTGIENLSLTAADVAAGNSTVVTAGLNSALQTFTATTAGDLDIQSALGTAVTGSLNNVNLSGVAGQVQNSTAAGVLTINQANNAAIVLGGSGNNNVALGIDNTANIDAAAGTGNQTLSAAALVTTNAATITGGTGNDTITGGAAADLLSGGAGNDTITGGNGADTMSGGTGADIFNYAGTTNTALTLEGSDTLQDFVAGTDLLNFGDLTGTTAFAVGTAAVAGETLITASTAANNCNFVSGAGAVALSAEATFAYDTATNKLYFDSDGTGVVAAPILIGTFTTSPVLTNTSFTLA